MQTARLHINSHNTRRHDGVHPPTRSADGKYMHVTPKPWETESAEGLKITHKCIVPLVSHRVPRPKQSKAKRNYSTRVFHPKCNHNHRVVPNTTFASPDHLLMDHILINHLPWDANQRWAPKSKCPYKSTLSPSYIKQSIMKNDEKNGYMHTSCNIRKC